MILIDAKTDKILTLPIELYCTGASSTVSNSFVSIAGYYGSYPIKNSANIGMYNFNITGTIEGKSAGEVEKIRSDIMHALYNKQLLFFRDDEDERFHRCVLNGAINVSFNAGQVINRIFTINFTLTSYEGVAWAKEQSIELLYVNTQTEINYKGQVPIVPLIIISVQDDAISGRLIQINKNGYVPLIQCKYEDNSERQLFLDKDTLVEQIFLKLENGILYSVAETDNIIKGVRQSSLLNPIILKKGCNKIQLNHHFRHANGAIIDNNNITALIKYRECFY